MAEVLGLVGLVGVVGVVGAEGGTVEAGAILAEVRFEQWRERECRRVEKEERETCGCDNGREDSGRDVTRRRETDTNRVMAAEVSSLDNLTAANSSTSSAGSYEYAVICTSDDEPQTYTSTMEQ